MCLCSEIDQLRGPLADGEDASQLVLSPATESSLEVHLETIRLLLSKSRRLSRNLPYTLRRRKAAETTHRERTGAIFQQQFDHEAPREVFEKFKANLGTFWYLEKDDLAPTNEQQAALLQDSVYSALNRYLRLDQGEAHQTLVRRLNSIVVYLLSEVLPARYNPIVIASSFRDVSLFTNLSQEELQRRIAQFRDAGNRYVNLAFKLGGIGATWCLPLEVARTAYERYLPKSGEDFQSAIKHLKSAGIAEQSRNYDDFVKHLIYLQIKPIFGDFRLLEMYLSPPKEIKALSSLGSPMAAIPSTVPNIADISPCPSTSGEVHSTTRPDMAMSQQQAATSSSPEIAIILLFHAMGGHIPKIFLDLASYPQRRFDKDGKQYEVTLHHTGLDQALIHLLDATQLRKSIEHLISHSTISVQGTSYICRDESARELFEQFREYWIH